MSDEKKNRIAINNEYVQKILAEGQRLATELEANDIKNKINETAQKTGRPPKEVAKNFFEKALGTVGDILGIAISVICDAGRMVVNIAGTICNSIINLIQSIANGIASIVTLNKTCVA